MVPDVFSDTSIGDGLQEQVQQLYQLAHACCIVLSGLRVADELSYDARNLLAAVRQDLRAAGAFREAASG